MGSIDISVSTLGSDSIGIAEKMTNTQPTKMRVGNSDAYKFEWVDSILIADSSESNIVINTKKIIFPNNKFDYSIAGSIKHNCNNMKDFFILFDQILSTFRFD